jgi:hypothetical protein
MGRSGVPESRGLSAGQYQLGQKITIVDCSIANEIDHSHATYIVSLRDPDCLPGLDNGAHKWFVPVRLLDDLLKKGKTKVS